MLFTISAAIRFQQISRKSRFFKKNEFLSGKTFKDCSQKVGDYVYGSNFSLNLSSMPDG